MRATLLEADRHQLARQFFGSKATLEKMQGVPAIIRDDVMEAAFQACADIGVFNRRYPSIAIEKQ